MDTCTIWSAFQSKNQSLRKRLLRKKPTLLLLVLAAMLFQSWDYYGPWSSSDINAMVPQPVGAWAYLTQPQRATLQSGGTVTGFNSGICSGVNPILLNITASPAPNASVNTSINARQPRRWGVNSFFLARQHMGGNGIQYCFDLSTAATFSMDSREHAYFALGENIRVSALNGVNPVPLTASYQGGPVGNASITGSGTGNVHFSANGKTGGGLWWSVSSGAQAVTQVCIQYYAPGGELPTIEPFRFLIDGVKCLADAPITCSNSAPVSRWGWLSAEENEGLDLGQPRYDFPSGFCDETGDPITFIEIDADPSTGSGNPGFLNNKPPRPYGRYSLDNTRETINNGGNTYCFTLDEARPIRLNSQEHRFFSGPERVRVRAWLGADVVTMAGTGNGPTPVSNANGLTFSGAGYGKGTWWGTSSGVQPVSKVCVETWSVGGGALTGEPFALELCATRCQFDDLYACSQNPGGSAACAVGYPAVQISKIVTPINNYGLNQCDSGSVQMPAFKVRLSMYNDAGGIKELFLYDDLNAYFGSAFAGILSAPQIVSSNITGPPLLDPNYDGVNYIDIFYPGTGWLSAGQELVIEFTVALNPNAPGALTGLCNTAFGGGNAANIIVSDLSGDLGGGFSNPTMVNNLPAGYVATPAQDVTLEATLMNYMNGPQNWVNTHGGAVFTVPGCGPVTWTSDFDMDDWVWNCSYIDGHIDVTFTATDNCGHTFVTCATFTLVDTQGPNCVKATNLDLDCGDPGAATDLDEWLNYDGNWSDLSQPVTFTHDFTGLTGSECSGDTITVTWIATDNCGNETIFVGYLTVSDDQAPLLQGVPPALNLTTCTVIPAPANVTATDACDPNVAVTFAETSAGTPCNQTITRTWTATDDCGNSISASQTITVVDDQPPVFSNVPADITAECPDVPPVQDPTATDCSAVTITFSEQQTGGACPLPNIIVRTWIATDACGLKDTVTQTITMTPPFVPSTLIFTFVPPDITVTCDQNPGFGNAVAETTCPAGGLAVSFTDVVNSNGDCSQPFSITRTWIAHDACGNMVSASQTISTGPDTQGPLFASDTPDSITVDCGGPLYTPVAFDNCGATTLDYVDSVQTGTCLTGFQFTRTWTATDVCGNSTTFVQHVTTNPDTTPPVFVFVPYDQFFDCDEPIVFPDPIAFDNCGDVTITWQDSIIGTGDCHEVNGVEYGYDIIRTWTATDECGNFTTATTSAWVLPGFNSGNMIAFAYVPQDRTVDCSGNPTFGEPVCHSACGPLTISFVDEIVDGGCSAPTTTTRHWTATDVCGNSTIAQQTITIQPDQTAPSFAALPDDTSISCAAGGTPAFVTPTVTDNCASGTSLTITHNDVWSNGGTSACASQSVTRTWTATDACGNAVSAAQTITIVDAEAPAFADLPADQTLDCGEAVNFGVPSVADGCSTVSLTFADEVLPLTCGEQHTRTWTATDACGNSVIAEQKITVTDGTAPAFSFVPDDQAIGCGEAIVFGTPEAADNCSTMSLTFADEVLPQACGEQHTRTWTATDACGNSVIAEQKITVTDSQAPVFSSQPENPTIECGEPIVFDDLTAVDGCGLVTLTFEDTTVPANCSETFTRTWTATDACGNVATASQSVTEVDTEAPILAQMPTELAMTQAEFATWTPPVLLATDCNAMTTTMTTDVQATCEAAAHIFNYTATDACGNATNHTLTVTLLDAVFAANATVPDSLDCGNSYALTASAVNGTAPYSFAWTVVEGEGWEVTAGASTELATLLAGEGTATLSLEVTDANGCAEMQAFTLSCSETASGTNEAVISSIQLLPNPAKDFVTVRYSTITSDDASLRILNTLGEVILLRNGQAAIGANEARVDVSALAAGTYFLTLQVGEGVVTQRFVKIW